jgi:Zn finger protein HypA/HybF involved in hydrogenase expression
MDADTLAEIYPDMDEDEIQTLLQQLADGEVDLESLLQEAYNNDVEIEWEFQYDDCWTDRKGGYEVTFELGDEDSYHTSPEDMPATHKCTHCRWEGKSYETLTQYLDADGKVIEDYWTSDVESDNTKEVCPMCDSDVTIIEELDPDVLSLEAAIKGI